MRFHRHTRMGLLMGRVSQVDYNIDTNTIVLPEDGSARSVKSRKHAWAKTGSSGFDPATLRFLVPSSSVV